jgi:hypothetical protein
MAIFVVGNEKNFAALRPRLFEGKVSTKAAGEVARAIREANPHADLDKLEPGTVLSVPDAPKVAARGGLSLDETTRNAIVGLTNSGKDTLAALGDAGAAREKETVAERKKVAKSLDAKEVESAARKDKQLAANLKSAREAVEAEDARGKERAATLKKASSEWAAGLDALKGLVD